MKIRNRKIDEDEFLRQRRQVLAQWETGREVDLEEGISYQRSLPPHKRLVDRLKEANREGRALFHNLTGQSTVGQQIDYLTHLQEVGQSDLLQCICDSYTRTCRFQALESVVKECESTGKSLLNGFPLVTYGVRGNRKLIEAVDRPVGALGPSADPRLAIEIACASGYTQIEDCSYIVFETYTKTASLEEILGNYQYTLRLAAYYEERGAPISVTAASGAGGEVAPGIAPPSIGTAGRILGVLSAATQGLKHITIVNRSHGNLVQDVASSVASERLARKYLERFGLGDVELFVENGCLGGAYPYDFDQAFSEVIYAAVVAALSRSHLCQVKTFDETVGIPTKENQARSLRGAKMMYRILRAPDLDFVNSKEVSAEAEREEREATAIVEKVLEMGEGDALVGAVRAYECGVLDNPVANNPRVVAKVMGVKDAHGAVRYLSCGNLPFSKDIVEFHREKVSEREAHLGRRADYDTVVADMRAIASGEWLHRLGY